MGAFLAGCLAVVVIGVGAGFLMTDEFRVDAQDRFVSPHGTVRLGEDVFGRDRYIVNELPVPTYPSNYEEAPGQRLRLDNVRLGGDTGGEDRFINNELLDPKSE